jgi:transposase-like protein
MGIAIWFCREHNRGPAHIHRMKKSDIICPECHAGYRRIELAARPVTKGEYRCLVCDRVLEVFDGSSKVAIRLTVQPEKTFETSYR